MDHEPKLSRWNSGKPSIIGEYNASVSRHTSVRRWWNGEDWSLPFSDSMSVQMKRKRRRIVDKKNVQWSIEWRGLAVMPKNFVPPKPLEPLRARK